MRNIKMKNKRMDDKEKIRHWSGKPMSSFFYVILLGKRALRISLIG